LRFEIQWCGGCILKHLHRFYSVNSTCDERRKTICFLQLLIIQNYHLWICVSSLKKLQPLEQSVLAIDFKLIKIEKDFFPNIILNAIHARGKYVLSGWLCPMHVIQLPRKASNNFRNDQSSGFPQKCSYLLASLPDKVFQI